MRNQALQTRDSKDAVHGHGVVHKKTIGLLGGMSFESTLTYYRLINEEVRRRLGGLHSARLILYSVDFAEIAKFQNAGNWSGAAEVLKAAAANIELAGADLLLICTNTMHKVADQVSLAINIPLLHIADPTAERLLADDVHTVGLLGTRFTMSDTFYRSRLEERFALKCLVPMGTTQDKVHDIIFQELCCGILHDESRQILLEALEELRDAGAEAVILGCTELALLLKPEHTDMPLYDTTLLHVLKAVEQSLS